MSQRLSRLLQRLLLLLFVSLELVAAQRFGALDLSFGSGLLPRYYKEAVPAVQRRDAGCATGFHSCR